MKDLQTRIANQPTSAPPAAPAHHQPTGTTPARPDVCFRLPLLQFLHFESVLSSSAQLLFFKERKNIQIF